MTIGPYRISERLGTGGMGEVFKAYDDRLDRWVAIKRIRPGKEDTDDNRERFQREARATAQLNHSAIVHVYDIFRDGDSDCIVMEYVEGRTLQSLTAEEPLDPALAATLGQEIAEGLAAAHAKGILHRDLKTENIIVTPERHAKILDFGLAKPLLSNELDASLTGKGQLVGTSRSMSPEYVGGEEVDHRSDLFALGVLLYETVAGHSPFKAQNTLATLKQVIIHQQPPTREMNPDVSPELSDLIDRLLEKSPDDRPQSAVEVADQLGQITGQLSSGTIRAGSSYTHTLSDVSEAWSISRVFVDPSLRRYWLVIAGAVVAALVGAYFLGRGTGGPLPEFAGEQGIRIVLGQFENLTGESILDVSLNTAFRVGLEQSRRIEILPESQIREALSRMERDPNTPLGRDLGVEVCQREDAHALIVGNITRFGDEYLLSAEIVDPGDGGSLYTSSSLKASGQGQILGALDEITQEIRASLGESVHAIKETTLSLEKVTTHDLDALKAYSLGLLKGPDNSSEAITLLEQAVSLDPQFAMAHAKLGMFYLQRSEGAKVTHHFDQALKNSDRLTPFEELYVKGWSASLSGTTDEMISAWSLVTSLYPENWSGFLNLGMIQWLFLNDFTSATEAFEASYRLAPHLSGNWSPRHLAYCRLAKDDHLRALEIFEEHQFLEGMADTYIAQEDYPRALEILESEPEVRPDFTRKELRLRKALFLVDQGRFREVVELSREITFAESPQDSGSARLASRMALITALEQLGDGPELRDSLRSGVEAARVILESDTTDRVLTPIPYLAVLGKISARHGDIEQAGSIHQLIQGKAESSGVGLWLSYLRVLEGEILIARGELARSGAVLEAALAAAESFQARESLAHFHEANGDLEMALQEYSWLNEHRGRTFSECLDMCLVRSQNVVAWSYSLLALARLHERTGNTALAQEHRRRFVDRWAHGDQTPVWREASRRLEELSPKAPDGSGGL